ncbi:MAG TPA: type II toxin-antitoxin system VapC family toxin [Candidatus Solibacter sp.]|nr:type II toxin-antitoxin system VapC family toxin [Candidatus Solibacter sp.]
MTILDTNVISELMKARPAPTVRDWMSLQPRDDLFMSTISMAEILFGIELLPQGKRRDGLLQEAEITFTRDFAGRILAFDEQAARIFGSIVAARRTQGRPIGIADGQIAAIARCRRASLATRDTGDFEGCDLALVNPWNA